MTAAIVRCPWAEKTPLYRRYHDEEWGVPLHDPRLLFAMLSLEGMQAGLSWQTILQKRAHYFAVCDGFDAAKIARYDAAEITALLADPGIVRNRRKIHGLVTNARAWCRLAETTDPVQWLWQTVDGKPQINHWTTSAAVPSVTPASERLAKRLQAAGFTFVGATICYAFMQAVGMVNDHLVSCFCHPDHKENS